MTVELDSKNSLLQFKSLRDSLFSICEYGRHGFKMSKHVQMQHKCQIL